MTEPKPTPRQWCPTMVGSEGWEICVPSSAKPRLGRAQRVLLWILVGGGVLGGYGALAAGLWLVVAGLRFG